MARKIGEAFVSVQLQPDRSSTGVLVETKRELRDVGTEADRTERKVQSTGRTISEYFSKAAVAERLAANEARKVARAVDEIGDQARQSARAVDGLGDELSQMGRKGAIGGAFARIGAEVAQEGEKAASTFSSLIQGGLI